MKASTDADSRQRVLVVATVAMIAWGALAFGGNYPWAYRPLMIASTIIGAGGLLTPAPGSRVPVIVIACLASVAVATLIQLVPLSSASLLRISPATDALLREQALTYALSGADSSPTHPLSIEPAATWTALAFLGSYTLLMIGTSRFLTRYSLRRLILGLVGVGALLAVVGIVQKPLFDGRIYGFWEPQFRGSSFGPFVNKDHFAGWMLMGLPLAMTYAIARTRRGMAGVRPGLRNRVIWLSTPEASEALMIGLAAGLMGLALLLTLSRSGILSCFVAVTLIVWKIVHSVDRREGRRGLVVMVVVVVIAAVGWAGAETLAARFADRGTSTLGGRLPVWHQTIAIIRDFPLAGTGLNTYGRAMISYQTLPGDGHLNQAHNDYLQLAAEGGVLLGIPILVAIVLFVREVHRRFEKNSTGHWLRFGACCGLIAVATQSLADFSLQMPGNAAMFAVLGGIALHGSRASDD